MSERTENNRHWKSISFNLAKVAGEVRITELSKQCAPDQALDITMKELATGQSDEWFGMKLANGIYSGLVIFNHDNSIFDDGEM